MKVSKSSATLAKTQRKTWSTQLFKKSYDRAQISNPDSWILFQWFHDKSSSGGETDTDNVETHRLAWHLSVLK